MTPTRRKRLLLVLMIAMGTSVAAVIFFTAFKENIMYFKSPTEVVAKDFPTNRDFRLGGMVKEGSMKRVPDTLKVQFVVTDFAADVKVEFEGILPDLFREGQGVVTIGQMTDNQLFIAAEVLAKHDENYMPPEAAEAIKMGKNKQSKTYTNKESN